ncbi:MAG: hypothetical protein CGW95_02955 [Phenylobacterium zucineum]|nr:MAG: hypothetical protein CGW95_02955 [Phenylobacterium zucineum]
MKQYSYVAFISQTSPGDFIVTFPDVPEAITQGDTLEEAYSNASDALSAALEGYLEFGREFPNAIPPPEPEMMQLGHHSVLVAVEPAVAARAMLTHAMKAQGLTKVGLAARLKRDEKVVRRILAGKGASLDLTLEALRAVGLRPGLFA